MSELGNLDFFLIGLIFIWSGFVRSGLGFGGAVFSLPFLLLVLDEPLVFLPIIAVHLVIFSSWIMLENYSRKQGSQNNTPLASPDWNFLKKSMKVMIIPKLIGILGLLTFPPKVMSIFVFSVVGVYSITYIINIKIESKNKVLESFFLTLGGYVSGSSLTAAPLIIPVFANNVDKYRLRSTLFALWFFLVTLKLSSFVVFKVDLQLIHHLWLFPCALIGHLLGNKAHKKLLQSDSRYFYRILGIALFIISIIGLIKTCYE